MSRRHSRGMTLVEIIAALAVTGFALLGAILLLDQLTDSAARITHSGIVLAANENGARILRQLLIDAYAPPDSATWFRGDPQSADFSTSCQNPGGWLESCRAELAIDRRGDSSVVLARLSTGEQLTLARRAGSAEFRYYDAGFRDSAWTNHWSASVRMPAALGLVIHGDTLVYATGASRE